MSTITRKRNKPDFKKYDDQPYVLLLLNDDYNTFVHVIETLMKVLSFSLEQSSNIASIVHNSGSCDIKYGEYNELKKVYDALSKEGLNCDIDENK